MSAIAERIPQTASCPICKNLLLFNTDGVGRAIERCSNRRCVNHQPHRPQPDVLGPPRRNQRGDGRKKPLHSDSYNR